MRKLSESIWNDIRRQSSGKQVRVEDDINILDLKELCEYMNKIYHVTTPSDDITCNDFEDGKFVVVCLFEGSGVYWFMYYNGSKIEMTLATIDKIGIYNKLKKNYATKININTNGTKRVYITPKGGEPMTNRFYLDFLDYILSEIKPPLKVQIEKKVTESVWNDIRKQSSGKQERIEDNVDPLDRPEFFEYLKSHYKFLNGTPNDSLGTSMMIPAFSIPFRNLLYLNAIWYKKEKLYSIWLYYNEQRNLEQMESVIEPLKEFCKMINHKTYPCKFEFKTKDGSPLSNTFLIRIIDTIIENAQFPCMSKMVEESVWNDIRKQSSGASERKEDQIGNLKDLSPIDMGGSVLWADLDLEYDNNFFFKFNEVFELIKNSGWRLPTLEEVAELDILVKNNKYFHDYVSFYFTNNGNILTFLKRGMYHHNSGWLDKDRYYYAWTSDLYDSNNVHDFTMDDTCLTHSVLGSKNQMDQCIQHQDDKLCVRLVKDKKRGV